MIGTNEIGKPTVTKSSQKKKKIMKFTVRGNGGIAIVKSVFLRLVGEKRKNTFGGKHIEMLDIFIKYHK